MREICGEFVFFQQGPAFILPDLLPPNSIVWTRLTTKIWEKYSSGSSKFRTVKNLENRPIFLKVMNECIVTQFFLTHCVQWRCRMSISVNQNCTNKTLLLECLIQHRHNSTTAVCEPSYHSLSQSMSIQSGFNTIHITRHSTNSVSGQSSRLVLSKLYIKEVNRSKQLHSAAAATRQKCYFPQPKQIQGSYYFAEFIFPDFSRQNE